MKLVSTLKAKAGLKKLKQSSILMFSDLTSWLMESREKLKDIPKSNYDLGLAHFKKGNLSDAIMRFRIVIFLNKNYKEAYYQLARCLIINEEPEAALTNLDKVLELYPDYQEALYEKQKLVDKTAIKAIPSRVLQIYFNFIADKYNQAFAKQLNYMAPKLIIKRVMACLEDKNPKLEVLDIGCGTGLCGIVLKEKELVKKIQGIDLAQNMVDEARKAKFEGEQVYDDVVCGDFKEFLSDKSNKNTYDLIIAAGIVRFYGDVTEIFSLIKKKLSKQGMFAFSVESHQLTDASEEAENSNGVDKGGADESTRPQVKDKKAAEIELDFELDIKLNLFKHSKQYIKSALINSGFKIKDIREAKLYDGCDGFVFIVTC